MKGAEAMSVEWWYVRDGVLLGPTKEKYLIAMLADGELGSGHWVWNPTLHGWTPIRDIASIQPHLRRLGVQGGTLPAPDLPLPAPTGPMVARPLSRLLALLIDMMIGNLLLSMVWFWTGIEITNRWLLKAAEIFPAFILIPFTLLLLVPVLALTGTSPGKALLGLRLTREGGGRPSITTLLRRQARLWMEGMGFGIAFVMFVTWGYSWQRVTRGSQTRWDQATGLRVWERGPGRSRQVLAFLLYVGFVVGSSLLNDWAGQVEIEQQKEEGRVAPTPPSSSTWQNPVTGKVGRLLTGWIAEEDLLESGGRIHWFWTQGRDGSGSMWREFSDQPFSEFATRYLSENQLENPVPYFASQDGQPICIRATKRLLKEGERTGHIESARLCGLTSGEVWFIKGWWPEADEPEKARVEALMDGLESTLR